MKKILVILILISLMLSGYVSPVYYPPDKSFESITVFSQWFYDNYHPVDAPCYTQARNLQKIAHSQGYLMDIEILDDAEYYIGFKKHLPEGEYHAVVSVPIGKELIFAAPLSGRMWVGARLP